MHVERQLEEYVLEGKEVSDDKLEAQHQEDIPSWDEIDAWWKAGLLDPGALETAERCQLGANGRGTQFILSHNMSWEEGRRRRGGTGRRGREGRGGEHASLEVGWTRSTVIRVRAILATMTAPVQNSNNRNKQSGGVPVVTDDDVHAPTGTSQFEGSVTYECHERYSLDDTVDSDTSFMNICGAALNPVVAVSPVLGISEETSCRKVTCGVPPDASCCRVFAEDEVSSQDVVKYSRQAGKTATGLTGENGTFKWRYESSGNLAFVGSGKESCQPVPCEIISLLDAHYGTIPTSSFVCNQSAHVTCNVNCCTHTTSWQAKSYSVFCVFSDTLPDLEAVPQYQFWRNLHGDL